MITNLTELNNTITSIIDRAQEFIAAPEKNRDAPFDYYAVSDLINREDWQKYFGFMPATSASVSSVIPLP